MGPHIFGFLNSFIIPYKIKIKKLFDPQFLKNIPLWDFKNNLKFVYIYWSNFLKLLS